jgi:hypothetical protein
MPPPEAPVALVATPRLLRWQVNLLERFADSARIALGTSRNPAQSPLETHKALRGFSLFYHFGIEHGIP